MSRHLLAAALLLTVACKTEPAHPPIPVSEGKPAKITSGFTASAQVAAVSREDRRLTLRREDGSEFDLTVDPAVRNFDQIGVGDMLRVRYQETLTATKLPAGSVPGPVQGALAAARAKPGAKPAAGVGYNYSLRVRIESIDREHEIVTFSLASGELGSRKLQTNEGREFAAGLKVGDVVQLDYAEALALGVEKN